MTTRTRKVEISLRDLDAAVRRCNPACNAAVETIVRMLGQLNPPETFAIIAMIVHTLAGAANPNADGDDLVKISKSFLVTSGQILDLLGSTVSDALVVGHDGKVVTVPVKGTN